MGALLPEVYLHGQVSPRGCLAGISRYLQGPDKGEVGSSGLPSGRNCEPSRSVPPDNLSKDHGSIAAGIKMKRMVHNGAVLLVEDEDDVRFWTPRSSPKND